MTELLKLRRFLDARPEPAAKRQEVCELCGDALLARHGHVIDIPNRRLLCSCRPCYLLFTHAGAAGGKFRSVPDRYARMPESAVDGVWEGLDIPVGIAFFIHNSALSRVVGLYPSPAGATESQLPLERWNEMIETPSFPGTLEPDVEALLVYRRRGRSEAWIVPVDACYELVGRIRRSWKGFEGGEEAWREIDSFFDNLAAREAESCL
jgi:hypothetical protein